MCRLARVGAALALNLILAAAALGHGGTYNPGPTRPPKPGGPYGGPIDTPLPPPTTPGSGPVTPPPQTPGAGGPRTPPGSPTSPGGAGVVTPGASGVRGKKNSGGAETPGWQTWWLYNREPYLGLRRRLAHEQVHSGKLGFLDVGGSTTSSYQPPGSAEVAQRVVPVLLAALAAGDAEIADSALIALGRSAPAEVGPLVADAMREALQSANLGVRQSAILGLGMLGERSAVPALWSIMNDTGDGRRLLDRKAAVMPMDRALAAIAIGLGAGPELVPQVQKMFVRAGPDQIDMLACAVLALGLIDGGEAPRVDFLSGLLTDATLDWRVRAQVPITLARLGDAAVALVPTLFAMLADRREHGAARQSAIIALGELCTIEDQEVIGRLRTMLRKETDTAARQLTFIALARIAARALADRSAEFEALRDIRGQFLLELADPSHPIDAPWCLLALGVLGFEMPRGTNEHADLVGDVMRTLKRTGNPAEQGAAAIALGLLGSAAAGELLAERFQTISDPGLRGHFALALGMIGHAAAGDDLRAVMLDPSAGFLRVDAAMALGMIGDPGAAPMLVEQLVAAPTFASIVAVTRALGRIGDRSSIEPLAGIIADASQPAVVRAFACVALGLIAERTPLPFHTPLATHANYLVPLPALAEVLDIL